jgi:hypothetical protein
VLRGQSRSERSHIGGIHEEARLGSATEVSKQKIAGAAEISGSRRGANFFQVGEIAAQSGNDIDIRRK